MFSVTAVLPPPLSDADAGLTPQTIPAEAVQVKETLPANPFTDAS
jgi:hypothetical protein